MTQFYPCCRAVEGKEERLAEHGTADAEALICRLGQEAVRQGFDEGTWGQEPPDGSVSWVVYGELMAPEQVWNSVRLPIDWPLMQRAIHW